MFHLWQSDEGFQFTHYTQNESWAHPTLPHIWLLSWFQPCTRTKCINCNLQWPDVAQLTTMPVSGQKSITHSLLTYLNTPETIYTALCLVISPCTLWSGYKHFRGHMYGNTHAHTHTQMKTCNFQIRPTVLLDNYVSWCSIPTVCSLSQQPSLSSSGEGKIPSRYGRRPLHVNWDVTASKGWSSKVDAQVRADNHSPLKSVHYEMLHRASEHCNESSRSIKCGKCLE